VPEANSGARVPDERASADRSALLDPARVTVTV
jgi:hypothetical protein